MSWFRISDLDQTAQDFCKNKSKKPILTSLQGAVTVHTVSFSGQWLVSIRSWEEEIRVGCLACERMAESDSGSNVYG